VRTPFKVALAVTALLCIGAYFLVDVVPPRSLTAGRMLVTKRRIIQYARQHDHLPADLSELPPMPNYDTAITDAWGRPLDYSFDASEVVTLRSLGADKRAGGDGDNRDMIGIFAARDPQGRWQDELCAWTKDPLKP
jgi:hypothetical protein